MGSLHRTLLAVGIVCLGACDRAGDVRVPPPPASSKLPLDLQRYLHPTTSELMTEQDAKREFEHETKVELPDSAVFIGAVAGTPEGEPFTESRYNIPHDEVGTLLAAIEKKWTGLLPREGYQHYRVRAEENLVVRDGKWFTTVQFDPATGVLSFSDEED